MFETQSPVWRDTRPNLLEYCSCYQSKAKTSILRLRIWP